MYVGRLDRRISSFTEDDCWNRFRFKNADLHRLIRALRIPPYFTLENRGKVAGEEAFLILLARFAYPQRYTQMREDWGREESQLCRIFRAVIRHLFEEHRHLLQDNLDYWKPRYCKYAEAITAKGNLAATNVVMGFIDGTQHKICRPGGHDDVQREVYSGHKRFHALKFQAVVFPDGMVGDLFGPVSGRRHDNFALRLSAVNERLAASQDGEPSQYVIYGDAAYPILTHIRCGFKGANLTNEQKNVNRVLSSLRICVEWEFGNIAALCAFIDFDKTQKLFMSPIGQFYMIAALIHNCRVCLYGGQTSQYYDISPPTLEDYCHVG